jgi:hypothetical protein
MLSRTIVLHKTHDRMRSVRLCLETLRRIPAVPFRHPLPNFPSPASNGRVFFARDHGARGEVVQSYRQLCDQHTLTTLRFALIEAPIGRAHKGPALPGILSQTLGPVEPTGPSFSTAQSPGISPIRKSPMRSSIASSIRGTTRRAIAANAPPTEPPTPSAAPKITPAITSLI